MIIGLLALVLYHGLQTFWPLPLREFQVLTEDAGVPPKTFLGEVTRSEWYRPEPSQLEELQQRSPVLFAKAEAEMKANDGRLRRQLIWTGRTGALDFAGNRAVWINNYAIESETAPEWAVVVERLDGGRSYGTPQQMMVDGKLATGEPQQIWRKFTQTHGAVAARRDKIGWLDRYDRGAVDRRQRSARLSLVSAQLDLREAERTPSNQSAIQTAKATVAARQADANQVDRAAAEQKEQINQQIKQLEAENDRFQLQLKTTSGEALDLPLANIVRAYPANQLIGSRKVWRLCFALVGISDGRSARIEHRRGRVSRDLGHRGDDADYVGASRALRRVGGTVFARIRQGRRDRQRYSHFD